MKRRILILIPVLGVAAFFVFNYVRRTSATDPNVIRVSGNVEITDAEVGFRISGRVQERLVSEGDSVKTGQLVARLDRAELEQQVSLQKAEVEAAKATLAELEAGSRPEEIEQAVATLQRNKAEVRRLQSEYKRHQDLYQQGVVSERDWEAAKAAYDVAIARENEAAEQLTLARKGPRKEKIDQAQANLQRSKEALAVAETRLSYSTLESPLTGIVLSENVEPGEYVIAGTPVVTVGELRNVWVRAYIDETDLGRVKIGQPVRVTTDTYPGKIYEGRVSFLASEAEFTPKNVQTEKERVKLVYRVKIDIANPNLELKPGMPADAEIVLVAGQ